MNKVYYIKPNNFQFSEAISVAFAKALVLIAKKNLSNIKLIVSHSDLVGNSSEYISKGIDLVFNGKGDVLTEKLRKQRGFSIPNYPTDGTTTGVNLLLVNNRQSFTVSDTVGLLIYADYDSFIKIESALFRTEIDLIAVVQNETDELDELLSATRAENISVIDPKVQPYENNFTNAEKSILERLRSINITNIPSNSLTQKIMANVIAGLRENNSQISYKDFLGFLVNQVNYNLDDSIELLRKYHKYFGR